MAPKRTKVRSSRGRDVLDPEWLELIEQLCEEVAPRTGKRLLHESLRLSTSAKAVARETLFRLRCLRQSLPPKPTAGTQHSRAATKWR